MHVVRTSTQYNDCIWTPCTRSPQSSMRPQSSSSHKHWKERQNAYGGRPQPGVCTAWGWLNACQPQIRHMNPMKLPPVQRQTETAGIGANSQAIQPRSLNQHPASAAYQAGDPLLVAATRAQQLPHLGLPHADLAVHVATGHVPGTATKATTVADVIGRAAGLIAGHCACFRLDWQGRAQWHSVANRAAFE